jgi:TolB-like protein
MKPLFLLLILLTSFTYADKVNIAVLELTGNGVNENDLAGLSNRLRTELFKTGEFTVVERSQMDLILKEQGFQQSGCTSSECAVDIGQMLNVKQMVAGSIDKVGNAFIVDVRLIDVETGVIYKAATEDCIDCTIEEILVTSIRNVSLKLATPLQQGSNIKNELEHLNTPEEQNSDAVQKKQALKSNTKKIYRVQVGTGITFSMSESTSFGLGGSIALGFKHKNSIGRIHGDFYGSTGYVFGAGISYGFDITTNEMITVAPTVLLGYWMGFVSTISGKGYGSSSLIPMGEYDPYTYEINELSRELGGISILFEKGIRKVQFYLEPIIRLGYKLTETRLNYYTEEQIKSSKDNTQFHSRAIISSGITINLGK